MTDVSDSTSKDGCISLSQSPALLLRHWLPPSPCICPGLWPSSEPCCVTVEAKSWKVMQHSPGPLGMLFFRTQSPNWAYGKTACRCPDPSPIRGSWPTSTTRGSSDDSSLHLKKSSVMLSREAEMMKHHCWTLHKHRFANKINVVIVFSHYILEWFIV